MINAKKAKALRKFLRVTGLDFRQAYYQVRVAKKVFYRDESGILVPQDRLQMRLNPDSGRAVYKRLKPLWA